MNFIQSNQGFEDQAFNNNEEDLLSKSRNNFIVKVYTILSVQLGFTTLMTAWAFINKSFEAFLAQNVGLVFFCIFITFVILIAMQCWRKVSEEYPFNMILLAIFTVAESYAVAYICILYEPESVIMAALVTAAASFALTAYAMYTKTDYSTYWSSLNGIAWGILLIVFLLTIMNFWVMSTPFVNNLIAVVFAIIYMAYLIIDTQLIIGNRKHQLNLDNYVLGAIFLYIDIIGLFLELLRILGRRR